jgi:P-type Cu+ transporter
MHEPVPPPKRGIIYTCPMHPQIRRMAPGNCPICGMALEPLRAGEETGPSPELIDMTRRFWIGAALAVPTVILEMGGHFPAGRFSSAAGRRCATDRLTCSV